MVALVPQRNNPTVQENLLLPRFENNCVEVKLVLNIAQLLIIPETLGGTIFVQCQLNMLNNSNSC